MVKNASDRLILISPFLKLNDRIKELLEDKNRLKIDVRIVYGKNELQPEEINWLKELTFIRTSFCKNLHAKCYMNEQNCIITSLNLYEFSQINNNEMGILLSRNDDHDLYSEAYEEAQRIIRISDEVRMSLEKVVELENSETKKTGTQKTPPEKLSSSKLARQHKLNTKELLTRFIDMGYLIEQDGKNVLTSKGESAGGELKVSKKFGPYFIWPTEIPIE